jgi:hypothetical protein
LQKIALNNEKKFAMQEKIFKNKQFFYELTNNHNNSKKKKLERERERKKKLFYLIINGKRS